jgi:hypothetical protein
VRIWARYLDQVARASELLDELAAVPFSAKTLCQIAEDLDAYLHAELHDFERAAQAKPRFHHDCQECIYLGQFEEYDLYWCGQGGLPTVLARWSDRGADYLSGMPSPQLREKCPSYPPVEAWRRAKVAGLDVSSVFEVS